MALSLKDTELLICVDSNEELIEAIRKLEGVKTSRRNDLFFVVTSIIEDLQNWYKIFCQVRLGNVIVFAWLKTRGWKIFHANEFSEGSDCGETVILRECDDYNDVVTSKNVIKVIELK